MVEISLSHSFNLWSRVRQAQPIKNSGEAINVVLKDLDFTLSY